MRPRPGTVLFGASLTMVVGAVAVGLFVLGTPAEERARRVDDRRVADLQAIAAATDLYWTRHAGLPASLEDLAADPGITISTDDPDGAPGYSYRAVGSALFEVCASFDGESAGTLVRPALAPPIIKESCVVCHSSDSVATGQRQEALNPHARLQSLWAHGSGRQCFELQAEAITRSEP